MKQIRYLIKPSPSGDTWLAFREGQPPYQFASSISLEEVIARAFKDARQSDSVAVIIFADEFPPEIKE